MLHKSMIYLNEAKQSWLTIPPTTPVRPTSLVNLKPLNIEMTTEADEYLRPGL